MSGMKKIVLKKGVNIPLEGTPEQKIYNADAVSRFGIVGNDFVGFKPDMNVQVGEAVKEGTLLFGDKKNPGIRFVAPFSGKVVAVNRGDKRKFLSLELEIESLETKQIFRNYNPSEIASLDEEKLREAINEAGLWTSFICRPFGKTAPINAEANYIYVTAADTRPLSADVKIALTGREEFFAAGVRVIEKFARKKLFINVTDENAVPFLEGEKIEYTCFQGAHPAGLAGTHIHFLAPAHLENVVWQINWEDVVAIGELFLTGKIPTQTVIALGGTSVSNPRLLKTIRGAWVSELLKLELKDGLNRVICGSPLYGRKSTAPTDYLNRYINQVSAIPEGIERHFMGWAAPGTKMYSIKNTFLTAFKIGKPVFNTNLNGGKRPIVPIGSYEEVMPLDILITYMLRSISVNDTETSEKLGCLELLEEDLSLCTFVCPGKQDYAPMLRLVLNNIEKDG